MGLSVDLSSSVKKLNWNLLTDSSGNVEETSEILTLPKFRQSGRISTIIILPSESNPPSNNFDVTVQDEFGIDILRGQGNDLPSDSPTVFLNVDYLVLGHVKIKVINGGAQKALTILPIKR